MKTSQLVTRSVYKIFFGFLVLSFIAFPGVQIAYAQNTRSETSFFSRMMGSFMRRENTRAEIQPIVAPVTATPAVKTPDMVKVQSPITPVQVKAPVTKSVTVTKTATTPDVRATTAITNQVRRPVKRNPYESPRSVIDPNRSNVCDSKNFNKDNYRIVDLRAGTDDNYATATESAGQYAGTSMYVNHRRVAGQGFAGLNDQSVNNRRVFSFDLSDYDNIACAYIYADTRRTEDPLMSTDSFFVHSFTDNGTGVTPEYCNKPGELSCFGTLMLDKDPDFLSGDRDQFYTFDLSELARHDGRSVDFIKAINENKNLHFGIQDDTAIDYMGLILYIPR